ncbi:MAG TPA: creatininase family protein [Acetobacteraceae bacterium]|nr:creatininase family protein [Acetobacteraceae bacterium]
MPKLRLSELTGGEAREELARNPVILLPMGSHEDQGPHAPMGDWMLADAIAERIAGRATDRGTRTLVAPTLPFGGSDYFGSMPGGIALGQATLRAVICDMLACLLRHGLTRIVVINGHAGNVQAIHDATQPIWIERKLLIPSLYLWRIGYALLPGIVGAETAAKVSGHGADPLTSIGLHLFPGLMRPDLVPTPLPQQEVLGLKLTAFGVARFEGAEVAVPVEYHEVAPDGVRGGDPRLSSAATGAALVEQLTEIGARFVRHYANRSG